MPQWASENSGASVSESTNRRSDASRPELMEAGETLVDGAPQAAARQNKSATSRCGWTFNDVLRSTMGKMCVNNIPDSRAMASQPRHRSFVEHRFSSFEISRVVDVEEQPFRIAEAPNVISCQAKDVGEQPDQARHAKLATVDRGVDGRQAC